MLELWLKIGGIEVKLGHSNISDAVLKTIRKHCRKNQKEEEKQK